MEYTEKIYTGNHIEPVRPYFCGRRLRADNHRFGPTERSHFWMIYLKEGSGLFTMNGHTHKLANGDMFVAYPGRTIRYEADTEDMWSIYWIALDENGILPFLNMMDLTEDMPVVHTDFPSAAEHTFEALFEKFSKNSISDNIMCTGLILQLFSYFTADDAVKPTVRNHIDEAMFFLQNHISEPVTIGDCARAVGLVPAYLSRLFRSQVGITPTAWLRNCRLQRAAVMLKETDLTVSEISQAVGIRDPLYFSRCFSKKFGCSPKKYRE